MRVYIADGGAPVLVRLVSRRADTISDFGHTRLLSESSAFDLTISLPPGQSHTSLQKGTRSLRRHGGVAEVEAVLVQGLSSSWGSALG